jgi:2,3-bisphosphoglycerate-dependent phosphoglycerate mutase
MKLSAFIVALLISLSSGLSGLSGEAQLRDGPISADNDKVVFLVRHGETCTEQGNDAHLSQYGKERATELARIFLDVDVQEIFSTTFNRTVETATPTAELKGVEITQIAPQAGFLELFATKIRESGAHHILVSGHSNTTPALINLLIGTALEHLTEFDYDRLFVVTLHEDSTGSLSILRYGPSSGKPEVCGV